MLRIKRLYATICALLVIQATYWTIIIIKKKKKDLISYARISYYKQVKKKVGFFLLQKYKQIDRLRMFIRTSPSPPRPPQ